MKTLCWIMTFVSGALALLLVFLVLTHVDNDAVGQGLSLALILAGFGAMTAKKALAPKPVRRTTPVGDWSRQP